MANSKFVAALLLLFFSFEAGRQGEKGPIVIDRQTLVNLSYTKICDENYMMQFNQLVFIKAFVIYEENQRLLLTPFQKSLKQKLVEYRAYVQEFLNNIDQEINNLELLPPLYIETKFKVLLRKAYTIMGREDFVPLAKEASPEHPNLKKTLEEIEAELSIQTFTPQYLEDSKEQLNNHWQVEPFTESTRYFVDTLPNALVSILEFLHENYDPKNISEDTQYLIDFFNVFGRLIGETPYHNFVLKFLTAHLGQKPLFQDKDHPKIFKKPEIFDVKAIAFTPYKKLVTVDRVFHHPDNDLYKIQNILALTNPPYVYHPNWLEFFRYEGRHIPISNKDNDETERQRVIDEGFKNIYYVYTHARQKGMVPFEMNENTQKIADTLYDFIIDTDCYTDHKNECEMSALIPHQTFSRNYIVMLALLKPFTSRPDNFDETDIPKIVTTAKNLGIVNINNNVPGIKIDIPEFNKKISRQRMSAFEDDLKKIAKPIVQANKDQPESRIKKAIAKEVKKNPQLIEETLVNYFPTLNETPATIDEIKDLFDDVEVILDKIEEDEETVSQVLIPVIKKKLPEIDFNAFDPNEMVEEDQNMFYNQVQRSIDISDRIHRWIFSVTDHPAVTIKSPFFRYLTYTSLKLKGLKANEGKEGYFKYARENEIHRRDIFVFNYLVKYKHDMDEGVDEETLEQLSVQFASENQIDLEEFQSDEYFVYFKHSFEFMIPFFNLFSLFENFDKSKKENKFRDVTEYAHHFDKLYQFLIDLRINMEMKEEEPLKYAHQNLLQCMGLVKDHIISGSEIPDVEYNPPEYEDETEDLDQELNRVKYLREYQPCKQNYSTMSGYYYFLLVEASSKHPEILADHQQYFENFFPVKTEVIYSYVNNSENWFQDSFFGYCSRTEDQVCVGEEVFRKVKDFMATATDQSDVQNLLEEKLESIETMTKHGSNMSPTIFWDVMHGISSIALGHSSNYDKTAQLFTPKRLVMGTIDSSEKTEFILQKLADKHKNVFTKYIALKYFRRGLNQSEDQKKFYSAVKYLMNNTQNLIQEMSIDDPSTMRFCKFLIFYTKDFKQFGKITDIMVQLNSIQDFFLWNPKQGVITPNEMLTITSGSDDPKIMANQIAHVFKFKSVTPQTKPTPQTKAGVQVKKGGMGGLTANKKLLANRQNDAKKLAEKVNQDEEVVVGDARQITEITETFEVESQLKEVMQTAQTKPSFALVTTGTFSKQEMIKQIKKVSVMKSEQQRRLRLLRRVLV